MIIQVQFGFNQISNFLENEQRHSFPLGQKQSWRWRNDRPVHDT